MTKFCAAPLSNISTKCSPATSRRRFGPTYRRRRAEKNSAPSTTRTTNKFAPRGACANCFVERIQMALDKELLCKSFALFVACEPDLTHHFYELLFTRHPQVRQLF